VGKVRHLAQSSSLPEWFLDALQEFISTQMSPNFLLSQLNSTTLQVVAGVNNDQVSVAITKAGVTAWRKNVATVTSAVPGGLTVGIHDVYVTAFANGPFVAQTGPPSERDDTVYTFGLKLVTAGGTPSGIAGSAEEFYRLIGHFTWDGAAIVDVRQIVGNSSLPNAAIAQALHLVGTLAARPVAGAANSGFYYFATDVFGGTFYQSNGSTWGQRTNGLQQSGLGAGVILDFAGPEANIPPNTCPADGRALSTTTQALAYAKIGNTWDTFGGLVAPGAGLFRAPDLRGRGTIGKSNMGVGTAPTIVGAYVTRGTTLGALIGEEFHTLSIAEMPAHQHGAVTGAEAAHTHTGTSDAGTSHTHGFGSLTVASHIHADGTHTGGAHVHTIWREVHNLVITGPNPYVHLFSGGGPVDFVAGMIGDSGAIIAAQAPAVNAGSTGTEAAHTHTFTSAAGSSHTHSIALQGGGGAHENVFPVAVLNKVMTLA
jgi:microcystin-dependent protein